MTINAKIIADSISPAGIRLTTFQLRYPRFIHAELMTHRMFSRNASSSRAIPVSKMIEDLCREPAIPIYWGSNQRGMQAGAELEQPEQLAARLVWMNARDAAIRYADSLIKLGLHKQIANRILEPWAHINVVVTATQWENFFTLRRHKDAQPEIKALADCMFELMLSQDARPLQPGEWHLPYVVPADWNGDDWDTGTPPLEYLKKVSVARCARVSYMTHDGRPTTYEEDAALYDSLVGSQPLHASPAEHQATPDTYEFRDNMLAEAAGKTEGKDRAWEPAYENPHLHGNLHGWIQLRKTLDGEFVPG